MGTFVDDDRRAQRARRTANVYMECRPLQRATRFCYGIELTGGSLEMLLFVYGTLRRDAENHHELHGAKCLGRARTQPRYELVDMGGYPALLEDGADAVVGEVYEIDATLLAALDVFEAVPELYQRKAIAIDHARSATSAQRSQHPIEAYVMTRERAERAPRLPNGDWIARSHWRHSTRTTV